MIKFFRKYAGFAWGFTLTVFGWGCAALSSVTPADRASAYKVHARSIDTLCAAYTFDRATGLVGEVQEMTRACGESLK